MSIINLIAHKGRPPTRPAIIQLATLPLADDADGEQPEPLAASELVVPAAAVSDQAVAAGMTLPPPSAVPPAPAAEVLVIPGTDGPRLVFSRGLVNPRLEEQSPPKQAVSPPKAPRETGTGEQQQFLEVFPATAVAFAAVAAS